MTRWPFIGDRFWSKVDIRSGDECWEWKAGRGKRQGYGIFNLSNPHRPARAHRVAYELAVGPIPAGLVVRHRCDNTGCVNPDHLEIGTQGDNIQDMHDRGRWHYPAETVRGENGQNAKLTNKQVDDIRGWYAAGGWTIYQLADAYGVSTSSISRYVNRQTYA